MSIKSQSQLIVIGITFVLLIFFLWLTSMASDRERASCAERGGTFHEGIIAGNYSYWCDEP